MSVGRLKPEERVNLAIGMIDVCVRVCADAVRDRYPAISEDAVIEQVRERLMYVKRRGREVQELESFEGLVRRIVTSFNAAGIDYMFTGALAASYYGVPRTTVDVDVVVHVARGDLLARLGSMLEKAGLEVSRGRVDAALKSGFRIVAFRDRGTPFTLDIILSGKKLEKRAGSILGLPTFYQTSEDLILAKLRMIKATIPRERALKDEDDVRAILKFSKVDVMALRRRAQRDGTLSILEALVASTAQ